ncbi:MAG: VWA-like domain-containing protein [Oscillospiraceae bacterium]|nr:VWA-like domain-containing protein [Oscillospiraceae bacterium]
MDTENEEKLQQAEKLARQVLQYARNSLFLNLRFMDSAVSRLFPAPCPVNGMGTDTRHLFFDSLSLLRIFAGNNRRVTRMYLHTVLHCVFQHPYVGSVTRLDVWDLACDIAVEQMIRDLALPCLEDPCEGLQSQVLIALQSKVKIMNAEHIYRYFMDQDITDIQCAEMQKAFYMDDHSPWYAPPEGYGKGKGGGGSENYGSHYPDDGQGGGNSDEEDEDGAMSEREARESWDRISRQIQVDLETFSKSRGDHAGNMIQNLKALHRERCDYSDFLRRFSVYGEVMHIDEDTFDYNFYTYGMDLYGDMPLVEPLEYKEMKRVREFVVAIDTSGSVAGETVQKFVQKTYNILKQQESFFSKVNIHIIQCDADIQEDAKITCQEEFDIYIQNMKIHGLGGTDFRPVFSYVDELIKAKEFQNLKGLIYFTDGYGRFPTAPPAYKAAFVFLDEECNSYNVPPWAISLVLEKADIEEEN